ncbi:MAG TPA: hypothetical protein V6D05_00915 [Stenomitos sp.]
MTKSSLLLASLIAMGTASPALAQAAPTTSVGGLVYSDYRMPTPSGPQSFNVRRAFLTGRVRLDPTWSGQVTVNPYAETWASGVTTTTGVFTTPPPGAPATAVTSVTATTRTEPFSELLQMAFVQGDNLLYGGSMMQLGMVWMPWSETEYTYWDYRMLSTVPIEGGVANYSFGEATPAYISIYDQGLKWKGNHGWLRYNLAFANGEGFRATETDGRKSLEGSVTLSPITGLDFALLGRRGNLSTMEQADRASLIVGYTTLGFRVAVQATRMLDAPLGGTTTNGQILSAFGTLPLTFTGQPLELVLRADSIDPNVDLGGDDRVESILGLAYRPLGGNVTFVLDNQNVSHADGSNSNQLALHTRLAF